MRLIHRTNYWGKEIDSSGGDNDVPFDAIWVQAVPDRKIACCWGFGKRTVAVSVADLKGHHDEKWSLYLVTTYQGRNSDHFFCKFVLIPVGTPGYGKRGCRDRGWKHVGDMKVDDSFENLSNKLNNHAEQHNNYSHVHLHIGLLIDTIFAGSGNKYS